MVLRIPGKNLAFVCFERESDVCFDNITDRDFVAAVVILNPNLAALDSVLTEKRAKILSQRGMQTVDFNWPGTEKGQTIKTFGQILIIPRWEK